MIFIEIMLARCLMTYLRTIYFSKHTQFSLEQIQQGTDYTEKRVSPLPFATITGVLDRSKAFEEQVHSYFLLSKPVPVSKLF